MERVGFLEVVHGEKNIFSQKCWTSLDLVGLRLDGICWNSGDLIFTALAVGPLAAPRRSGALRAGMRGVVYPG